MTEVDRRSKRFWERLAVRDPYYYTFPEASHSDYYATGQRTVDELLGDVAARCPRNRALEIGCGLGRLTFALAEHFDHVTGIDIGEGLLAGLRSRQHERHVANVVARRVDEDWELDGPFDLVLSLYVLQHVPAWTQIDSYLESIERTLTEDGIAILHFDTRPITLGYRLRSYLPGFLAPRNFKPGYRRHRRSAQELERRMVRAGLRVVHAEGEGTLFALYTLARAHEREAVPIAV